MPKVDDYIDIINYKYLGSSKHEHMSLYNRAAQFQPFAALTGYDEAIKESQIIPNKKIILTEEEMTIINDKLLMLDTKENKHLPVSITYFVSNKENDNGKYETITSEVRYIDKVNNIITLKNNKKISITDITYIDLENINNK